MSRAVASGMARRGWGRIINMAFYAGFPAAWEAFQVADEVLRRPGGAS